VFLDEKIVAIGAALEAAKIPHAFGGAQALAYYGTPRATHDIDLNVFVAASGADRVLQVLGQLGVATAGEALRAAIERDGQARLFWDRTPIDLFFSYDPLHDSSMERRRRVDFGGDEIHVLSAEDLMVYKIVFDREKDWRDLAEVVFAASGELDLGYVRSWLGRIVAESDPRLARFERLVESGGEDLGQP
jgi:hypothetical protein